MSGGGGDLGGGEAQPQLKKKLDIIDHMTEHLQSYEGRYLVVGGGWSPPVYYQPAPQPQPPPYLVVNPPPSQAPHQQFVYSTNPAPPQSTAVIAPHHYYTHGFGGGGGSTGESGGCLIESVVGNWSPDLTGTYTPFGGGGPALGGMAQGLGPVTLPSQTSRRDDSLCPGSPPNPQSQPQHHSPTHSQPPVQKKRIVAEVKPMLSYSDVVAKSRPLSPANKQSPVGPPGRVAMGKAVGQVAELPAPVGTGSGRAVHRPTKPQTERPRDPKKETPEDPQPPVILPEVKKAKKTEQPQPQTTFDTSKQFKSTKKSKTFSQKQASIGDMKGKNRSWEYGEALYSHLIVGESEDDEEEGEDEEGEQDEGERECEGRPHRPHPTQHHRQPTQPADPPRPKPQPHQTATKADRSAGSSRGATKTKRSQRASKRKENKLGVLCKKCQEQSSYYLLLLGTWLLDLLIDVTAMSAALLLQLGGGVWWSCVEVLRSSWGWLRHRWGRRGRQEPQEGTTTRHTTLPPTSLSSNIHLPTTGEEAMKRLLSCKGKDPYSILGLASNCTDDEIRRYYRSQALLVHPDKNSQPGAEEAFKILVHAFDLIAEPEKRAAYDRYVAETNQVEQAWSELSDLLSQLHEKMQYAATTIRCNNCGKRHKRVLTERPIYAARFCAQCNIHHSAKEGDMWCEWGRWLWSRRYLACMEGSVYEITEWAKCQGGGLTEVAPHSHLVHYRVLLGGAGGSGAAASPPDQGSPSHDYHSSQVPDFDDLLSSLYGGQNGSQPRHRTTGRHKRSKKSK